MVDILTDLVPVSPGSFEDRILNPIVDPWISAGLRRVLGEFGTDYPHEKVGIIILGGFLEMMQFNQDAIDRTKKVDGLAIWIMRGATNPPVVKYGDRLEISRDFTSVTNFTDLPGPVKFFIKGCETQLIRRVLAIGCEVPHSEYIPPDQLNGWETHWIKVPLTEAERFPGDKRVLED